jgi:anthranilate synthase component 1
MRSRTSRSNWNSRAMRKPEGRGPYAGAVGYLSHSGDMDTCIAIRTVVVRDGHAHVQAGAGIVVDSDPSAEYEETLNKARAVVRAVRAASSTEECCE